MTKKNMVQNLMFYLANVVVCIIVYDVNGELCSFKFTTVFKFIVICFFFITKPNTHNQNHEKLGKKSNEDFFLLCFSFIFLSLFEWIWTFRGKPFTYFGFGVYFCDCSWRCYIFSNVFVMNFAVIQHKTVQFIVK